MEFAEVVHAVLEIAHVAKEVFRHFRGGLDSAGRSYGRVVEGLGTVGYGGRWCWMPEKVGGHHDEEESSCERKDGQEVGIEANRCVDCEKREGVRGILPGEQTDKAGLEDEDNANAGSCIRLIASLFCRSLEAHRELKRRICWSSGVY